MSIEIQERRLFRPLAVPSVPPTQPPLWTPEPRKPVTPPAPKHRRLALAFTVALVEALAGERSTTQLLQWCPLQLLDVVRKLAASPATRGLKVVNVTHQEPGDEALEIAATVNLRGRAGVLALRLSRATGQWQCTRFEFAIGSRRISASSFGMVRSTRSRIGAAAPARRPYQAAPSIRTAAA
ncbi:MAG: Rv3235 family protein [Propionibacteriaceae bacterium]|jgi:hypothetical protein|nr:Rv3235 family protein [Propionibacteriaceae bacterium]